MLLITVPVSAGYYFCFPFAIGGFGFFENIEEMFALYNKVSNHFRDGRKALHC